jgi:hypothetical protein
MTAIWEQALDEIEAGRLTLDAFVAKQASWIAQLIEHCGTLSLAVPVAAGPTCPFATTRCFSVKESRAVLVMPGTRHARGLCPQRRIASDASPKHLDFLGKRVEQLTALLGST